MAAGWGAHSSRAGYASDSLSAGVSFDEIREIGRRTVDASLRKYLDKAAAMQVQVRARASGLGEVLAWSLRY